MHSNSRNLLFLLGMAPLALGCRQSSPGADEDDGDSGTDTLGEETGIGDGDGDPGDGDGDDPKPGDICEAWAANMSECFDPEEGAYVLEWCTEYRELYEAYSSAACFAAWEASIECFGNAPCNVDPYVHCDYMIYAQIQECYYNDGFYNGCDLYGNLVGECASPAAGAMVEAACDEDYEQLYNQFGGGCGDAFLDMMVCLSKLECGELGDPGIVELVCGPELALQQQSCS